MGREATAAARPLATRVWGKRLIGGLDALIPRRNGAPVLLYHRVGAGSPSTVDLPPDLFGAQLDTIADRVRSLDDTLAWIADPVGPAPVAVTFDDGTADFADHAFPALAERGLPVTLYVATRFVEDQVAFPWGAPPVSWAALADLQSTGLLTVASHTHTHLLLDRADPAEAADELDRSCGLIQERLGCRADHFAYPKALAPGSRVEPLVRSRFRSAALAGTRANVPGRTDDHRLARSPIQTTDGLAWFGRKVGGGMGLEDRVRSGIDRVRHRGKRQ